MHLVQILFKLADFSLYRLSNHRWFILNTSILKVQIERDIVFFFVLLNRVVLLSVVEREVWWICLKLNSMIIVIISSCFSLNVRCWTSYTWLYNRWCIICWMYISNPKRKSILMIWLIQWIVLINFRVPKSFQRWRITIFSCTLSFKVYMPYESYSWFWCKKIW